MEINDFNETWFKDEISNSVEIDHENIEIIQYYEGSVIVEYYLTESALN
jgi:hypothetical protein